MENSIKKAKPENKTCPKCSKQFECLHNSDCWCFKYKIPAENLKIITETYDNCLCPDCLKEFCA